MMAAHKHTKTQHVDAKSAPTYNSPKPQSQTGQGEEGLPDNPARLEIIPSSQRRGFLGRFTIIPEVSNPRAYSNATKWVMTSIAALAATTSSTGSSIFYPALGDMAIDLKTTTTITNLSLAFYLLAMAITPMWWSHFSESLGRRNIYIISFSLFTVFSCISAVSVNIAMLVVMRIFSGGAAASVQAVGAGTLADLWEPKERGRAMGIFYLGPLCGPGIAPIIGGALTEAFGWRSTLWFLAIFGGVLFLLIFSCLPETLARPQTTENDQKVEAQALNKGTRVLKRLVEPLGVLQYLQYPPILVSVYSAAIAFGTLYVVNISIQSDLAKPPYNFTAIEVGLVYLAPTLGYAVASVLGGRWIDYIMAREARKASRYDADGKPVYLPEDRLKENIWLAATLYPAGVIWYGWSVDKGLPWIVPCVAGFFFGIGGMLLFGAVTTVLTEFMPKRASSGVAINNLMRSTFACVGSVVTQPLINAMGTGWTCTMIGLFAWVTGNAAILALMYRGAEWRASMNKKLNSQSS